MTYQELDNLLLHLGFSRQLVNGKWLRYEHTPSESIIALVEKKPTDRVRITDAVSAREHLVQKGLISEAELDAFLSRRSAS